MLQQKGVGNTLGRGYVRKLIARASRTMVRWSNPNLGPTDNFKFLLDGGAAAAGADSLGLWHHSSRSSTTAVDWASRQCNTWVRRWGEEGRRLDGA